MKDRFKFRVWDKENKCLHYPTRYSNFSIVNGTVVKIESYPTANSAYLGKRIAWEFDDAVIMQCTGLKDKNGELIYEGDILQSEEYPFKNDRGYNYSAEVCYDEESASYFYYVFRISTNVVGRAEGNTGHLDDYEWKIIGNIYENPELLEVSSEK